MEEKLDGNCTRMQRAILNKSWKQHPTKPHLDGHQPPISKTIQIRWTWHAGHYWRSKGKLISDILMWTPSHGRADVGCLARTYLQHICTDTGCNRENLPNVMDNRDEWRGRIREIRARSMTWHDRYIYIYIYIYIYKTVYFLTLLSLHSFKGLKKNMNPNFLSQAMGK